MNRLHFETNRSWDEAAASVRCSVVMIGHRSPALLARAISSLGRHAPGGRSWELVLVVNGEHEGVRDFGDALLASEKLPLAVVRVAECRPGAARNHGVRAARSQLLFFLDDDIECYQDVITPALELFRDPAVVAAGGANLTPPGSPPLARATGGVMASWLGAASMSGRYRVTREGPASEHGLILCNLAVRRGAFSRERGFARHLISNEENVLLQRLAARGEGLWTSPRLAVFHARRDTWRGIASQAAKYGAGRAQTLLLVPESLRAFYFLPATLLVHAVSLPLALRVFGPAAAAPLAAYLAASGLRALGVALARGDAAHLLGALVLPLVHLSYGAGFLRALALWGSRRKELAEHVI